jgi:pyruvate dehydrogenase E1 component alpha subunit
MLDLYRTMMRIRRFEERVMDFYAQKLVPGLVHLYIGEEAIAAGVCANLRKDDLITSTHRGHGHCIAKGGDLKLMMAEIFGRATGYCHGKGGSMHIANIELGILGANGIGGAAHCRGAGLSINLRGTDQVVVSFFGDGACNQGTFHESLNLAAVWKLPVVFVCENNGYAISVAQKRVGAIEDYYLRKASYGIEGCKVDGNDVLAVHEAAREAVERTRKGGGPTLIECKTYRWRGHYEGEADRTYTYRSKEEIEEWRERCPVKRFKDFLLQKGAVKEAELEAIEKGVQKDLEDAVQFAMSSPEPLPEDALKDLYCEG